jgi:low molecular weight protein-tyrosine phosphatase
MESGPPHATTRVLFVCSGNICRSPLAAAVFSHLAKAQGLEHSFQVDSAGTHGWHEGEPADPRARRVAGKHGIPMESMARPVKTADFENFDLILAMDRGHLRELQSRCPAAHRDKIRLMRHFDTSKGGLDVPDPYYDDMEAFEEVFAILRRCCLNLLHELQR